MLSIVELPPGVEARIISFDAPSEFIERVCELGLVPGTSIEVLRRAPFGDALLLRIGNTVLAFRFPKGCHVYVEYPIEVGESSLCTVQAA